MKQNVMQASVLMSFVIAGCCLLGPPSANAEEYHYTIKVEGGPDEHGLLRLKTFYERLLAELRVSDLGFANVGCDKCDELAGEQPEGTGTLTFRMTREGLNLSGFALSYHFVQANEPHELFKMTVDGTTGTTGLCPNPLPEGCRARAICIQTKECDKPYGGMCQVCPPIQ